MHREGRDESNLVNMLTYRAQPDQPIYRGGSHKSKWRRLNSAIRQHRTAGRTVAAVGAVHLTFQNQSGSVQHYYHFLLGLLVPLVSRWTIISSAPESGEVLVRSCAIMDPLLRPLRLPGLSIIDAAAHAAMRRNGTGEVLQFFDIQGYDDPALFDNAVFHSVRDQLLFRFNDELRAEMRNLVSSFPGSGPRIVIIRRLPGDPFYASKASERKTSGTDRRSIANIDELYASVRRDGGNAILTELKDPESLLPDGAIRPRRRRCRPDRRGPGQFALGAAGDTRD